jgi:hypothetical protein
VHIGCTNRPGPRPDGADHSEPVTVTAKTRTATGDPETGTRAAGVGAAQLIDVRLTVGAARPGWGEQRGSPLGDNPPATGRDAPARIGLPAELPIVNRVLFAVPDAGHPGDQPPGVAGRIVLAPLIG